MEQFQVSPYNIGDSLFPFCFESFLIFKQIKEKKFLSSEDILCVHRIFETGQSTGKEQSIEYGGESTSTEKTVRSVLGTHCSKYR